MRAITVTIGRDVSTAPMPANDWRAFRHAVHQVLETIGAEPWVDGATYRGRWEGRWEDAAVYFAGVDDDVDLPLVRATLAELAGLFGQETIGLGVGDSELVSAKVPALVGNEPAT